MPLPHLAKEFLAPGCFTLHEAEAVLGAKRAREQVRYLLKQGYAETVRRGLYVLVPERTGVMPDRYVLASKVSPEAYLSHHTALEVLGIAQTTFAGTLYVTVPTRVASFAYGGTTVRPIVSTRPVQAHGLLARVKRGGQDLMVSGRELTLVQCLDRPQYAGGLEEVLRSVEGFSSLDWDRLELLLEPPSGPFSKAALNAKVGFVVERNASRWRPPPEFLDRLAQRTGKGINYLGTSRGRGGRWVPRWRVIVPGPALEA
jgi:predicted transcriptional regulator of viral defense system